jgi:hypothetical protein
MVNQSQRSLLLRVCTIVGCIVGAKTVAHFAGLELITVNPLFSGIVAANVFLMGFLLSGVLSDFKESEKLPGELAASLENMLQEVRGIKLAHGEAEIEPCVEFLGKICRDILAWFHKEQRTRELMDSVNELTVHFAGMEKWAQAALLARLKGEHGALRRSLIRIHTIRETSFISSGYLIADVVTIFLCLGLVLSKIDPFYESLFFVGVISFLMVFLLLLIRDLDNPFGYYEGSSGEDVSLQPLEDLIGRLAPLAQAHPAEKEDVKALQSM